MSKSWASGMRDSQENIVQNMGGWKDFAGQAYVCPIGGGSPCGMSDPIPTSWPQGSQLPLASFPLSHSSLGSMWTWPKGWEQAALLPGPALPLGP